jgi:hypothetical protein
MILLWLCGSFFIGNRPFRAFAASYPALDPSTRKLLEQFDQLMLIGNREQMIEHLQRIINSAGYIPPLAKVYYKLAQNETNVDVLSQYYATLIERWPMSAWAQKAVNEFIPIILMSEGDVGSQYEEMIWTKEVSLLSLAEDAGEIGEEADLLQADVLVNLMYLAHYRKHASRVAGLANSYTIPQSHRDKIELAVAYASLRLEQNQQTLELLNRWLGTYKTSDLRPFALLALFHATRSEQQRTSAIQLMRDEFSDTLESDELKNFIKFLPQ